MRQTKKMKLRDCICLAGTELLDNGHYNNNNNGFSAAENLRCSDGSKTHRCLTTSSRLVVSSSPTLAEEVGRKTTNRPYSRSGCACRTQRYFNDRHRDVPVADAALVVVVAIASLVLALRQTQLGAKGKRTVETRRAARRVWV